MVPDSRHSGEGEVACEENASAAQGGVLAVDVVRHDGVHTVFRELHCAILGLIE